MKKTEESLLDLGGTMKRNSTHIMATPEGEEGKEQKVYLKQ